MVTLLRRNGNEKRSNAQGRLESYGQIVLISLVFLLLASCAAAQTTVKIDDQSGHKEVVRVAPLTDTNLNYFLSATNGLPIAVFNSVNATTGFNKGDILYAAVNGNGLTRLAATTNGYVLTLSGGLPVWAAPTAGTGAVDTVKNIDGTLTISPVVGTVVASLNLGHKNTWTAPIDIAPATDDTPLVIHANNSAGETPLMTLYSSGGSPIREKEFGDDGEEYFSPTGGLIDGSGSAGSAGQVLESQGSATLTPLWTTLSINNSIYTDTVLNNTLTFCDTIQAGEHDNFRHTTNNIYYYATMDASSVLTGIDTSLQNGYFLCIQNQSLRPNGIIVLDNENTASKPQNRIMTGIGKDLVIARFENALLVYVPKYDTDAGGVGDTVGRWVVVGGTAYERNSTGNTNYIYNQFSSAQTSSNFWIDGTGQVGSLNVAPGASNSEGTITTTTTLPLSSFLYKLPYHGGTFIVGDTGAGILTVTAPLKITNADGVTTISDTATGGGGIDSTDNILNQTAALQTGSYRILGTGTIDQDNIQTTSTPALTLKNSTAATGAVPSQWSPAIDWTGHYYNSLTAEWRAEVQATYTDPVWALTSPVSGVFYRAFQTQTPTLGATAYAAFGDPKSSNYGIGFVYGPYGKTSQAVGGINGAMFTLAGTAGSGTNAYASNISVQGGNSTGNVAGGGIYFKENFKGSSGSSLNTLYTVGSLVPSGTDATTGAIATLTVGNALNHGVGGVIIVPDTVEANNTTGGITIPGASDVKITHGSETGAFKITLPSGTEGQQLTITNTTSYTAGFASGTGVIVAGETKHYEYLNGAWQDLNALTMRPQSFVSPPIDMTQVVGTTWGFLTPSGGTLAFPTVGFTQFLPTDIIILCMDVTGPPTGQGLEVGDGTVPGGVLPSASAIIPTTATQEIIQPIPARAAGGSIYGAGVTPLITSTGQAIGGTLHVRVFMTGIYY